MRSFSFFFSRLFFAMIVVMSVGFAPSAKAQDEAFSFFQTINDVPVMPGLLELDEDAVIFDKAEGRIAKGSAVGKYVEIEDIHRFYAQTLPQLGWQQKNPGYYVRDDEYLKMSLKKNQSFNFVHFSVGPY
jgi:hypothetical protein